MNESNKFPSEDWKAGYKCAVESYTSALRILLADLALDRKKINQEILDQVETIMRQNRMTIHDEYYINGNFVDFDAPFIRVRRDLSDKKHTVVEWYEPKKTKVFNPAFRDDACIGDDSADE